MVDAYMDHFKPPNIFLKGCGRRRPIVLAVLGKYWRMPVQGQE